YKMRSEIRAVGGILLRGMPPVAMLTVLLCTMSASAQDIAPLSNNPVRQGVVGQAEQQKQQTPPGEDQGVYSDPFAPFNESMLTFNLKLDDWVLRPVASGYAFIAPQPVRESVGRFFNNVNVIPRFANNLFQLKFPEAGTEVARFGINTTLGLIGF